MTNPATKTMSIGLLANALLSWFLHRHLDNFIVTWQLRSIYRDKLIIPWLILIVWQIRFHMTAANRPTLRQACLIRTTNLFHLDKLLICTLPGLLLWLAYGNSRFCFWKFTKPAHEHHLQAGQRSCKPASVIACRDRWILGYCSKHAGIGNKLVAIFAFT